MYDITISDWNQLQKFAKYESLQLIKSSKLSHDWIQMSIDEICSDIIYACVDIANSYKNGSRSFVQYCKVYAVPLALQRIWNEYKKWYRLKSLRYDDIIMDNQNIDFRKIIANKDTIHSLIKTMKSLFSRDEYLIIILNMAGYTISEICNILKIYRETVYRTYAKAKTIIEKQQ